jgi:hypothetical protein
MATEKINSRCGGSMVLCEHSLAGKKKSVQGVQGTVVMSMAGRSQCKDGRQQSMYEHSRQKYLQGVRRQQSMNMAGLKKRQCKGVLEAAAYCETWQAEESVKGGGSSICEHGRQEEIHKGLRQRYCMKHNRQKSKCKDVWRQQCL